MKAVGLALLLIAASLVATPAQAELSSVPWIEGPVTDGLPTGQGRHFRLHMAVDVPPAAAGLAGLPVSTTLDLAKALADAGYPHDPDTLVPKGFTLDLNSFVLDEVSPAGAVIRRNVAMDLRPTTGVAGLAFDASTNPTVVVRWALPEAAAAAQRHFHLYFDSLAHGAKSTVVANPADLARLAASVGPGRGTHLYVALPSVEGARGADENRAVRITSPLGQAAVKVFEYDQFDVPAPAGQFTVAGGQATTYVLGRGGTTPSRGLVLIESDLPVTAEAIYRNGASAQFLPSSDGGQVGTRFAAVPRTAEHWAVVCPKTPEMLDASCMATLSQAGVTQAIEVGLNSEKGLDVTASAMATLTATRGRVAVQRTGPGFLAWPALDGPNRAGLFIGEAASSDRLHLVPAAPGTSVAVQSLEGSRPVLDGGLALDTPLDAPWNRNWVSGKEHSGGTASLQQKAGQGLLVQSGTLDPLDSARYGAMVALPSSDGGFTHRAYVPSDKNGAAMGRLFVFSPESGTSVSATRTKDGVTQNIPATLTQGADQVLSFDGPGSWLVRTSRPSIVEWLVAGTEAFSGFAGGLTDIAQVTVTESQYAARAFDLVAVDPIRLAQPNDLVEFTVKVMNAGLRTDGSRFADGVQLSATVPVGWEAAVVSPSVVDLPAEGTVNVTVRAKVPAGVRVDSGGATLNLQGTLRSMPGLPSSAMAVTQDLRISFVVQRSVQLSSDGLTESVSHMVDGSDPTTYDVVVKNRGSVADRYTVELSSPGLAWSVEAVCVLCTSTEPLVTPMIEPGAVIHILVTVQTNAEQPSGRLTTFVLATSKVDRAATDSIRLVTATGFERQVTAAVDEPVIVAAPGESAVFTVELTNVAEANENLKVNATRMGPADWSPPRLGYVIDEQVLDLGDLILGLDPQETVTLVVNQTVPAGAAAGDMSLIRVHLESTFEAGLAFDVDLRAVARRVDAVSVKGPDGIGLAPGQPFEVALDIESLGNRNQTIQILPRPSHAGQWSLTDGSDQSPPWNLSLVPLQKARLVVRGQAPLDLPPTSLSAPKLDFLVTAPGASLLVVSIPLSVPEKLAVRVDALDERLVAGMTNLVELRFHNDGNVPIALDTEWLSLPAGASGTAPEGLLPPGEAANLTGSLTLPAEGLPPTGVLQLHLRTREGHDLGTASVGYTTGAAAIEGHLERIGALPSGQTTYQVMVGNSGTASAYQVAVRLEREGEVVDQVVFRQVRPGAVQQANLLGPADSRGLEVIIESAQGTVEFAVASSAGEADRGLPAPNPTFAALAVLAVAALLARRRGP